MCKLIKEKVNDFFATSLAFQYLDEDADYISVSFNLALMKLYVKQLFQIFVPSRQLMLRHFLANMTII